MLKNVDLVSCNTIVLAFLGAKKIKIDIQNQYKLFVISI